MEASNQAASTALNSIAREAEGNIYELPRELQHWVSLPQSQQEIMQPTATLPPCRAHRPSEGAFETYLREQQGDSKNCLTATNADKYYNMDRRNAILP